MGPPGEGVPSGSARACGAPRGGGPPGRAWCEGEGLSFRDRDWLRGDALGLRAVEAGRPGLRGTGGLVLAGALPGPWPRLGVCLGRRSAATADPGGFCSWSLWEEWRPKTREKKGVGERRDIFRIALSPGAPHPQTWLRPWHRWITKAATSRAGPLGPQLPGCPRQTLLRAFLLFLFHILVAFTFYSVIYPCLHSCE